MAQIDLLKRRWLTRTGATATSTNEASGNADLRPHEAARNAVRKLPGYSIVTSPPPIVASPPSMTRSMLEEMNETLPSQRAN